MKDLGAKAYRFSIAWPRVFPNGDGRAESEGPRFLQPPCRRAAGATASSRIATLYHWDLPQSLQDRVGGWQSSDTSKAFGDYAGYVAERLSDRVKNFFTINEAGRFVNFGYGWAIDAPGLKLPTGELNQARHNVVLGHGLAVQAIRARARAGTRVGLAENIAACVPAIETPEHVRATEIATRELNAGILGVILEGQIHRTLSRICRQGRAEIHRRRAEDHRLEDRFRRPQRLCARNSTSCPRTRRRASTSRPSPPRSRT